MKKGEKEKNSQQQIQIDSFIEKNAQLKSTEFVLRSFKKKFVFNLNTIKFNFLLTLLPTNQEYMPLKSLFLLLGVFTIGKDDCDG